MYNPFSLAGKTILVTGASSGIGRATAIECSKMGATLVITARNEERLRETLNQLEGTGHQMIIADLADEEQLNNLVDRIPILNGLVNNAGIIITTPLAFVKKHKLQQVLDVNTIAPILLTQRILKTKKITNGGSIILTNSISGNKVGSAGNILYSTSKGAIHGFMLNAALELAQKNIRVNEVQPGMIETHILDSGVISDEEFEIDKKRYPLGRYGQPEEVARAMVYFLSDASSFCTGSSLVIDGGFTLL